MLPCWLVLGDRGMLLQDCMFQGRNIQAYMDVFMRVSYKSIRVVHKTVGSNVSITLS
jgi:hypothetical protein